ncbi:reverse transcriptase domain-containing protein [Tanacetum coccineum]
MSTRSSSSNLVPPSTNPENIIQNRRRNLGDPSFILDFEEIHMANDPNNVQGPPPVGPNFQNPNPDLRPMELIQAPTDGVGDAIVVPRILANQFELKIGLLYLVTAIAFHGFENNDPHSHIRRFTKITHIVKLNNVSSDNDLVSKFVNHFFPPSKTTSLRNEITRFQQRFGKTFSESWDRFKDLLNKCPHHGFSPLHQIDTFYNSLNQSVQDSLNFAAGVSSASGSSNQDAAINALTKQVEALISSMNRPINSIQNGCETCGGPHAYYECQAAGGYTQEDVYATTDLIKEIIRIREIIKIIKAGTRIRTKIDIIKGVLSSNTVPNLREDLKVITTWSGVTLAEPSVPPPLSYSKEVERDPKSTTDQVLTESTTRVPSSVVQPSPTSELPPDPVSSSVTPKRNPHQSPIPYPSRLNKEKLQDKSGIQIYSFLQMFKKLYFNISFAKALAHMPKYAKMVKDLLTYKEKLLELANAPLNENCSAILLKKLQEKLRDTGRFLIPCDFYRLESCMTLADLGASINLMPLSE